MSNLIDEIRVAHAELRRTEDETTEAAVRLRTCKEVERKARQELDALLDALENNGVDGRYPLFPEAEPAAAGNGQAPPAESEADRQPVRTAPLEFASARRKRQKEHRHHEPLP